MSVFKTYTEKELSQMSDEDVLNLPFVVPSVHFQKNGDFVDARKVRKLQEDENGQLKELHKSGAARLKRGIMSFGFDFVLSLFVLPDGSEWLGDGHGRINLFSMQWPINTKGEKIYEFPCVRYPVKDKKEAARRLLHLTSQQNKVTQEGIDWIKATYEISDFEYDSFINFDGVFDYGEEELEELEAKEDNYEEPDNIQADVVLGDLIEIGPHRLLCGDSTDSEQVARLMDGGRADILLTDPPYGIDYGAQLIKGAEFKKKTNKYGWRNFGNPEWDKAKPESGVLQYLCEITENQIIWGGNYFTDDLPPTMGWLIWDKGQRGFSLADGEMAWTSFNNALRIKNYARVKANSEEKTHPTQKPIEIINWCLKYADRHSKNKPINILDCYMGSGTTMVAAHQLNRKCYGMELDPKYCQVIIDRMMKLDDTLEVKINGIPYKKQEETAKTANG